MADKADHMLSMLGEASKLEGTSNYAIWKFKVKNILQDNDLWDIVTGQEPCPMQGDANIRI